ncbi:haloacid dehalogenase type II [Ferviditalea candida]|uniref:Haloacid dehalogenase type II n=1 Tax=Ferviditalea candida TaxID=3108399 RepID=A0ABU5ZC56_9BACL|nr:haloacid dehalogenase type II [Paenibacillaceae bacterium T2]
MSSQSHSFKLICFDVYTALMNIEGSISPHLGRLLSIEQEHALSIFRLWRNTQWNYLLLNNSMNNGFLPYKTITMRALEYALQKFGAELDGSQKVEMVHYWSKLNPWPEVKEVLAEIKDRGYQIAILSNGDEDMLEAVAEHCGIKFDYIFSADKAEAYKPSPRIYELPLKQLGLSREEVLHVAGSPFDTMGAIAAGMVVAWSNRFNDFLIDAKYRPNYEMSSLNALLEIL